MGNIKENVIDLFETFFDSIEDEYKITEDQITYLKNKVAEDIEYIKTDK